MDILSTLKGEYSRTLILILIPGGIALAPFANIYFKLFFKSENPITYFAVLCFIAAILFGFIMQDIGARIEMQLDKIFCALNRENRTSYSVRLFGIISGITYYIFCKKRDDYKKMKEDFYNCFDLYLFNLRHEKYIITHYYRSMLVRLKFEVHTLAAILVMWIGIFLNWRVFEYSIDWKLTRILFFTTFSIGLYLAWEAYFGVKTLHSFRMDINEKFKPSYSYDDKEILNDDSQ
jgi:hypothetical protein